MREKRSVKRLFYKAFDGMYTQFNRVVQSPELPSPVMSHCHWVSRPIISSLSFPVCTMGVVVAPTLQGWYEARQQSSNQVLGDDAREAESRGQKYRDRKGRAANVLG